MANTLEGRAMAYLHIARKAGRAVSGYTQVMRALAHAPVALLIIAEDTAPERRREYEVRCARRQIPYRSFLTKARLGELVGREESSAVGIEDARLSERLTFYLEGMRRLMER
jgi:ribosomal protein L7Ae-like RNA K-turn-binding protein